MFVKVVPLHNGEVKHVKIQVEEDETFATLKEKLKTQFKLDHFKVLFHGRQIHDSLAGDSPSIVNFKVRIKSLFRIYIYRNCLICYMKFLVIFTSFLYSVHGFVNHVWQNIVVL